MLGVFTSNPVVGATVTYDFTVNIAEGQYAGQYNGRFSYDDSTDLVPCKSNGVDTVCAVPNVNNLLVRFNFLGNTYTEQQDYEWLPEGNFPAVYFPLAGGQDFNLFGGLSFLVVPDQAPIFFVLGNRFFVGRSTADAPYPNIFPDTPGDGAVVYTFVPPTLPDPQPGPDPTPDPPIDVPPTDAPPVDDGGAVAVPEPAEIGGSALAVGLLGLGWYWRRRQGKTINLDRD